MTMTKKDYERIAKRLRTRRGCFKDEQRYNDFVWDLGIALLNGDPKFSPVKFMKSCGIQD